MVHVRLSCMIDGADSVFGVEIDDAKDVLALKEAIKKVKPKKIECDPDELWLSLAKRDSGVWLTQLEALDGVRVTSGRTDLRFSDATLRVVGLASSQLGVVSEEEAAAGKGPVHVLVKLPSGDVGSNSQVSLQQVEHSMRALECKEPKRLRGQDFQNLGAQEAVQDKYDRDTKKQKVPEAPDIWMKSIAEEQVDILPSGREALQRHLERELRVKIPITQENLGIIFVNDKQGRCTELVKKLFAVKDVVSLDTSRITANVMDPSLGLLGNSSEDAFHGLWHCLITSVLVDVTRGNFSRNTNHSTSTNLCRPDFCFYYAKQNVCVFRGEEKPNGPMEIPLQELHSKLEWRYDAAPYVFGYAATGFQVCLVTLQKDATKEKPLGAKVEEIKRYDLSVRDGRFSFFLALLNLSTLFRPVVELIQPFTFPECATTVRPNGVKLSFAGNGVVKVYPPDMDSKRIIANLKSFHGKMKKNAVPNVVNLVRTHIKKRRVELEPVGMITPPSDAAQLVAALRNILTALVAMHHLKLMHRDLRWDNVLKYRNGRDEWFLIDFDDGSFAPAGPAPHLNPESHAPEIASEHSVEVDIWGVGYLIRTAAVPSLPRQLEAIKEQCLEPNPEDRPTAAIVLKSLQKVAVGVR